jgi:fructose-1,6-bisphosphatase/inositol monophosphatase family enzyme
MSLVVDVKAVVDRMILELGYVSGDVDDRHSLNPNLFAARSGSGTVGRMVIADSAARTLAVLHEVVSAVATSLDGLDDWGLAGTRDGQYRSDLVADRAALAVIERAGLGALSEESGVHWSDRPICVVLDPVDGSTNAWRGLPWWATSACAIDADGPLAAVVANQATGTRFEASRGGGARCDGRLVNPTSCQSMRQAIAALSGYPGRWLGWSQYRVFGAAALDICAVAAGLVDVFIDCAHRALAPWDYLGGVLICQEAGASVTEAFGRDLVVRQPDARRAPVAAATPALLAEAVAQRVALEDRPATG